MLHKLPLPIQIPLAPVIRHLLCRIACPCRAGLGDAAGHNGIRANHNVVRYRDVTDDFRPTAYKHPVAKRRRTVTVVTTLTTNGDVGKKFAMLTQFGNRTYHNLAVRNVKTRTSDVDVELNTGLVT